MKLSCYAISDVGLVRTDNQDNLYINGVYRNDVSDNTVFRHEDKTKKRGLYAVADGMGGESHGELASLTAVQTMTNKDFFKKNEEWARYLIERNAVICDLINKNGGKRMGATFAGLYINKNSAAIVNIGDSKVYLFRAGILTQLSRDHTVIRQMVEMGLITKEAARTHRDRHTLTQHLGVFPFETIIEPYTVQSDVLRGDVFLLCSDGLSDMIDDDSILRILRISDTVVEKAEALFMQALENGGNDNITIIVVQVG